MLGVAESATIDEIRMAYLAKVRAAPPERDPLGFTRVQKAYAILKDAVQRKTLDLSIFRKELNPGEQFGEVADFAEIFRERIVLLLLASSDFMIEDFKRFYSDIDKDIAGLS